MALAHLSSRAGEPSSHQSSHSQSSARWTRVRSYLGMARSQVPSSLASSTLWFRRALTCSRSRLESKRSATMQARHAQHQGPTIQSLRPADALFFIHFLPRVTALIWFRIWQGSVTMRKHFTASNASGMILNAYSASGGSPTGSSTISSTTRFLLRSFCSRQSHSPRHGLASWPNSSAACSIACFHPLIHGELYNHRTCVVLLLLLDEYDNDDESLQFTKYLCVWIREPYDTYIDHNILVSDIVTEISNRSTFLMVYNIFNCLNKTNGTIKTMRMRMQLELELGTSSIIMYVM